MKQALAAIGTVVLACSLVYGQAPADTKAADSKLEFEVATIKASAPLGNGPIRIGSRGGPEQGDPGRITYHNSTLRDLLVYAYGVKRNQISGAPEWLDSQRFDITAKIPEGATKEQVKVMLQNLLADRFKAVLHHETKEMPMYALLVGKSGPKMKESAAPANPPPAKEGEARPSGDGPPPPPPLPGRMPMAKDGCPEAPPGMAARGGNFIMMSPAGACVVSMGQTMASFSDMLSNQFDRPVVDMTGLKGKFDFRLRYDMASTGRGMGPFMLAGPPPGGAPGGAPGPGAEGRVALDERDAPPSIFTALQEQLGLKLEPRKGPVDLLVIDHLDKTPTEN